MLELCRRWAVGLRRRYYLPGAVVVLATVLILTFFLVNTYQAHGAPREGKNFTLLERESDLLAADPALRSFSR